MKRLRSRPWVERLAVYCDERLASQRKWYSSKARQSETAEKHAFWTIVILQMISVLIAFASSEFDVRFAAVVPVLTSLIAIIFGWLQVSRHQEIAQAYSIAAHELRLALDLSASISSPEGLSTFVSDAENAISREHTMWLARRDVT
jgi:hypothetical protein